MLGNSAHHQVVYYSKMFQAVPHLAQIHQQLPGTFVTKRHSTAKAAAKLYPDMPVAKTSKWLKSLAKGEQALQNAELIVTGSSYKNVLAPYQAKKCTVFHGTFMLFTRAALRDSTHFDLLCIIGPRMRQMIERHIDEFPVNVVETGFLPFAEFPQQSLEQKRAFLTQLGLNPDNRTLVYTPSRRGLGSWDWAVESIMDSAPKDCNLILRPHPSLSLTPRLKDKLMFYKIKHKASLRPNTYFDLTSVPLCQALSVADLLISDANSPTEESLFYDVPQLLIETHQYSRETSRALAEKENLHKDDLERLLSLYHIGPSVFVNGAMDFNQAIETAMADAAQYADKRSEYFAWVFGARDRQAPERVAVQLRKLLNEEKHVK